MHYPYKLKNMRLTADGDTYIGVIGEITLPKLAAKLLEYQGGGMIAPIDINVGVEKLDMEITWGGLVDVALRAFGSPVHDASALLFQGAFQEDGTGLVKAVEVLVRGRPSTVDMGSAKMGGDTAHKTNYRLSYYCLTVDGEVWIEIDIMNEIFTVFGVDRMADILAAMGYS